MFRCFGFMLLWIYVVLDLCCFGFVSCFVFGFRVLAWKVCCLWKCNGWTSPFLVLFFFWILDFRSLGSADLAFEGGILSRVGVHLVISGL
jgi:hypothetical protein